MKNKYPPIHSSDIITFNKCPRLWSYQSSDWGYGFRPIGENKYIQFGNWGHYALALYYRGASMDEAVQGVADRQQELDDKDPSPFGPPDRAEEWNKFVNLMRGYVMWQEQATGRYADDRLEIVEAEKEFSLEIAGVLVDGQIDVIYRHKDTGEIVPGEYKFTTRTDNLRKGVQWDYQPRIYCLAVEKLYGVKPAGMVYTIIKNCDPMNVKILKSGLPSRAVNELESTTYEIYLAELIKGIEEHGHNRKETFRAYRPQLDYLKQATSLIYTRMLVPFSAQVLHNTSRQLVSIIQRMVQVEAMGDHAPPSFNRYECPRCPFKEVCQAQDSGLVDYEMMLQGSFVKHQERFDEGLKERIK